MHPHEYDSRFGFQESHHYGGIDVDEEANGNEEIPDLKMILELYAALEENGQVPNFTKVLQDLKWTLCPESSHSRFSFVVRQLCIKSCYRIINTAFNAILKLLFSAFPQSKLPSTYAEANKYLCELGLGYDTIHVCHNSCVLFRKSYAKMDVCPKCNESR